MSKTVYGHTNFGTENQSNEGKDMVNHPPHYNEGGLECIDYIRQQLGSQFPSDLEKARWYLNKLIDYYENM